MEHQNGRCWLFKSFFASTWQTENASGSIRIGERVNKNCHRSQKPDFARGDLLTKYSRLDRYILTNSWNAPICWEKSCFGFGRNRGIFGLGTWEVSPYQIRRATRAWSLLRCKVLKTFKISPFFWGQNWKHFCIRSYQNQLIAVGHDIFCAFFSRTEPSLGVLSSLSTKMGSKRIRCKMLDNNTKPMPSPGI